MTMQGGAPINYKWLLLRQVYANASKKEVERVYKAWKTTPTHTVPMRPFSKNVRFNDDELMLQLWDTDQHRLIQPLQIGRPPRTTSASSDASSSIKRKPEVMIKTAAGLAANAAGLAGLVAYRTGKLAAIATGQVAKSAYKATEAAYQRYYHDNHRKRLQAPLAGPASTKRMSTRSSSDDAVFTSASSGRTPSSMIAHRLEQASTTSPATATPTQRTTPPGKRLLLPAPPTVGTVRSSPSAHRGRKTSSSSATRTTVIETATATPPTPTLQQRRTTPSRKLLLLPAPPRSVGTVRSAARTTVIETATATPKPVASPPRRRMPPPLLLLPAPPQAPTPAPPQAPTPAAPAAAPANRKPPPPPPPPLPASAQLGKPLKVVHVRRCSSANPRNGPAARGPAAKRTTPHEPLFYDPLMDTICNDGKAFEAAINARGANASSKEPTEPADPTSVSVPKIPWIKDALAVCTKLETFGPKAKPLNVEKSMLLALRSAIKARFIHTYGDRTPGEHATFELAPPQCRTIADAAVRCEHLFKKDRELRLKQQKAARGKLQIVPEAAVETLHPLEQLELSKCKRTQPTPTLSDALWCWALETVAMHVPEEYVVSKGLTTKMGAVVGELVHFEHLVQNKVKAATVTLTPVETCMLMFALFEALQQLIYGDSLMETIRRDPAALQRFKRACSLVGPAALEEGFVPEYIKIDVPDDDFIRPGTRNLYVHASRASDMWVPWTTKELPTSAGKTQVYKNNAPHQLINTLHGDHYNSNSDNMVIARDLGHADWFWTLSDALNRHPDYLTLDQQAILKNAWFEPEPGLPKRYEALKDKLKKLNAAHNECALYAHGWALLEEPYALVRGKDIRLHLPECLQEALKAAGRWDRMAPIAPMLDTTKRPPMGTDPNSIVQGRTRRTTTTS
jgi:hypothetical protein